MNIDYKIWKTSGFDGVIKLPDNMYIPKDSGKFWDEYLKWVAQGNVAQPQYSLEERKEIRLSELDKKCEETCDGDIDIGLNRIIHSNNIYADAYNRHASAIERGLLKTELTVLLKDKSVISLNKLDLDIATKLTSTLHDLCFINFGKIADEINTSDNPESVDILKGWPEIPYS